MKVLFINQFSEELNSALLELGVVNTSMGQSGYSCTSAMFPGDFYDMEFFNGFGRPTFKSRDGSSAVKEVSTVDEFLTCVREFIKSRMVEN